MFGMKAKETARKWKDSEPKVDDVKAPSVDTGESFRAEKAEAPKKKQSFKEAFAAAKDGSTFTWNGKPYKKEYAKKEEPSYRPGGRGPLTRNGGSFPESKKNTPGGRGPQTRASTGPDSKKSPSPAAAAAGAAKDFITSGGGPAAGAAAAVAAGRYMTRGGGSTPSDGTLFPGLKAKRDAHFEALRKAREARGGKDEPPPNLLKNPGIKFRTAESINADRASEASRNAASDKARSDRQKAADDSFGARVSADLEKYKYGKPGMKKGGAVESKEMMKKEIGFMKKKGAPKSMIEHEEKEAKGMKSGGSCGSSMKKYARGGMVRTSEKGDGIAQRGKTGAQLVKMASGGSVSARADGIASKGKTNCKIC